MRGRSKIEGTAHLWDIEDKRRETREAFAGGIDFVAFEVFMHSKNYLWCDYFVTDTMPAMMDTQMNKLRSCKW